LSCCDSIVLDGGTFQMGCADDAGDAGCPVDEVPQHLATVAPFALDTFEVTVGRFRKYVDAFSGPPDAGAGSNPSVPNSGWLMSWPDQFSFPQTKAALTTDLNDLNCPGTTWSDTPGPYENAAINCVSWFEAFAFCAWDGGRLPTEAEWEYAASGGEGRIYPWGSADPSQIPMRANDLYSDGGPFLPVGSYSQGKGKFGQYDLAGGMWEWVLDAYQGDWYMQPQGYPCDNCADLVTGGGRVYRGGNWLSGSVTLRTAYRGDFAPLSNRKEVGVRCARTP
jgi:formylglycine-generating enzyme required for sulfatase activity